MHSSVGRASVPSPAEPTWSRYPGLVVPIPTPIWVITKRVVPDDEATGRPRYYPHAMWQSWVVPEMATGVVHSSLHLVLLRCRSPSKRPNSIGNYCYLGSRRLIKLIHQYQGLGRFFTTGIIEITTRYIKILDILTLATDLFTLWSDCSIYV